MSNRSTSKSKFETAYVDARLPIHRLVVLVDERGLTDGQRVRMDNGIPARYRTNCVPSELALQRATKRCFRIVANPKPYLSHAAAPVAQLRAAMYMRHTVRYCIGGWPTSELNRSANAERDMPASWANDSAVHSWSGRA